MIEKIKYLFFNEALKRWHFDEIVKETGISRERINHFLKELLKDKLIIRIKPRNRMPYYIANRDLPKFRSEKRLYGLKLLAQAGILDQISSLDDIETAIIFGSYARGDWNKSSDIDLFIYGDARQFDKGKFESLLKKEIQLFDYKDKKRIKKELDENLIPNIVKGFNIKGTLNPFGVTING